MKKIINHKYNRIRLILRYLSVVAILLGIWFAGSNIYKFSKGYFAGTTSVQSEQVNETIQQSTIETETIAYDDTEQKLYPERPEIGDEIGELYIPKLNETLPIFHGTNEDELEKGVGHFAGSVLPGEKDNSVLSGHRDTVFRKLGEVGVGDWLIVTTSAGEFKYKVSKVRIVDEDDRTVIVPKPKATLTVSTCYPFEYIGPAPKRYILVAYLAKR